MYLAIKKQGEKEIIINKSRFICSISRANTEEEANDFIKQIKKKHHNANHNCTAYIIGENKLQQKANDNGEPSGTAGIPMLEVLKKNDLTDTVCVVTRYFGGIKLGAGGLIRAYGQAVSETIKKVGIIEKKQMREIEVTLDYTQIGLLDAKLSDYDVRNKTYLEKVTYSYLVYVEEVDTFIHTLIELTNNQIDYELKDISLQEVDYKK